MILISTGSSWLFANDNDSHLYLKHFSTSSKLQSNANFMNKSFTYAAIIGALLTPLAHAADNEVVLTIKNHQFAPAEIKVPANQRIKLNVHNQDSTPEEFESHSLNREKLIPGGAKAVIYIGPLKPGRYDFFGEFNPSTAKGVVIAE